MVSSNKWCRVNGHLHLHSVEILPSTILLLSYSFCPKKEEKQKHCLWISRYKINRIHSYWTVEHFEKASFKIWSDFYWRSLLDQRKITTYIFFFILLLFKMEINVKIYKKFENKTQDTEKYIQIIHINYFPTTYNTMRLKLKHNFQHRKFTKVLETSSKRQ